MDETRRSPSCRRSCTSTPTTGWSSWVPTPPPAAGGGRQRPGPGGCPGGYGPRVTLAGPVLGPPLATRLPSRLAARPSRGGSSPADVCVVGSGVAGLCVALHARAAGCRSPWSPRSRWTTARRGGRRAASPRCSPPPTPRRARRRHRDRRGRAVRARRGAPGDRGPRPAARAHRLGRGLRPRPGRRAAAHPRGRPPRRPDRARRRRRHGRRGAAGAARRRHRRPRHHPRRARDGARPGHRRRRPRRRGHPARAGRGQRRRRRRGLVPGRGAGHRRDGPGLRLETNPSVSTGDGVALGLRAGAVATDLEFVQFHPTALYLGPDSRGQQPLVSEALRGEGALLRDAAGERFMVGVHPLAELAPRDVVAKAITRVQLRDGTDHVLLDARHVAGSSSGSRPSCPLPRGRHRPGHRAGAGHPRGALRLRRAGHRPRRPHHRPRPLRLRRGGLHRRARGQPAGVELVLEGLVFRRPDRRRARRRPARPGVGAAPGRAPGRAAGPRLPRPADRHHVRAGRRAAQRCRADRGRRRAGRHRRSAGHAEPGVAGWEATDLLTVATALTAAAGAREETRGCHWREDHPATTTPGGCTSTSGCTPTAPCSSPRARSARPRRCTGERVPCAPTPPPAGTRATSPAPAWTRPG